MTGFTVLLLTFSLQCLVFQVVKGVDKDCIVDDDLPWDTEGNYVDCKTAEQKKLGNTDCCKQDGDGAIGCCNKGDKYKEMKSIAIGVGVGTFCLCVLVFVVVYCNPKTFPCLDRCKQRVKVKYERFEEKSGCCKNRVAKRKQAERDANVPQYDGADHMRVTVKDDFWPINPY